MSKLLQEEMFGYSSYTDQWCCLRTPCRLSSWFLIDQTSVEVRFLFDEQVNNEQDGIDESELFTREDLRLTKN